MPRSDAPPKGTPLEPHEIRALRDIAHWIEYDLNVSPVSHAPNEIVDALGTRHERANKAEFLRELVDRFKAE